PERGDGRKPGAPTLPHRPRPGGARARRGWRGLVPRGGRHAAPCGMTQVVVRAATPSDAELIHALIWELAEYERLQPDVRAACAEVEAILFGAAPRAFCDIAERDGTPVGFALWFYSVSTFEGRHGIYLEDLYVRPESRGRGAGRALLTALAGRCRREGL